MRTDWQCTGRALRILEIRAHLPVRQRKRDGKMNPQGRLNGHYKAGAIACTAVTVPKRENLVVKYHYNAGVIACTAVTVANKNQNKYWCNYLFYEAEHPQLTTA